VDILSIDYNNEFSSLINYISTIKNYNLLQATTFDEANDLYSKNNISMVIIDIDNDTGINFLRYIETNHPKQRVVTISGKFKGSDKLGSEHCQKYFNKKRLMKPLVIHDLVLYIQNFDTQKCIFCDAFKDSTSFINNLDNIIKGYANINFDETNNILTLTNPLLLVETINKLSVIDNLEFEILNDKKIKLINKKDLL